MKRTLEDIRRDFGKRVRDPIDGREGYLGYDETMTPPIFSHKKDLPGNFEDCPLKRVGIPLTCDWETYAYVSSNRYEVIGEEKPAEPGTRCHHATYRTTWDWRDIITNRNKTPMANNTLLKRLLPEDVSLLEDYAFEDGDLDFENPLVQQALLNVPQFKDALLDLCRKEKTKAERTAAK